MARQHVHATGESDAVLWRGVQGALRLLGQQSEEGIAALQAGTAGASATRLSDNRKRRMPRLTIANCLSKLEDSLTDASSMSTVTCLTNGQSSKRRLIHLAHQPHR